MEMDLYFDVNLPGGGQTGGGDTPGKGPVPIPLKGEGEESKGLGGKIEALIKAVLSSQKTQESVRDAVESQAAQEKQNYEYEKGDGAYKTTFGKRRAKIEEYMQKKMVAADWFTSAGKFLKGMAKALGNFLVDLIGALLIFAMLGPEFLNSLISFVVSTITMIVEALIKAIPVVINALITWLPKLIDLAANLLDKLIATLLEAIPKIVPMLADALTKIVEQLVRLLPKIIKLAILLIVQAIKLIAKLLPIIIKGLVDAIPEVITALIDALPELLNALVEAVPLIIDALIKAVPPIIDALLTAIPKIYQAIIDALTKLGDEIPWLQPILKPVIMWFSFLRDIFLNIKPIIAAVVDVLEDLWTIIKVVIGVIIVLGALWWDFVIQPIIDAIMWVWDKILKPWIKFWIGMFKKLYDVVKGVINSILDFINPAKLLADIGQRIKTAIDNMFGPGTFSGIVKQITDIFDSIFNSVKDLFKGFLKWFKQEHSDLYKIVFGDEKDTSSGRQALASKINDISGYGVTADQLQEGSPLAKTIAEAQAKANNGDIGAKKALIALQGLQDTLKDGHEETNDLLKKQVEVLSKVASGSQTEYTPLNIKTQTEAGLK
jgi:phage-related protein